MLLALVRQGEQPHGPERGLDAGLGLCTSGCNIGGLAYCKKFWPNTTSIRQVPVSSKPASAWANAGCYPANDEYDGSDEFECVVD